MLRSPMSNARCRALNFKRELERTIGQFADRGLF
jgi:hypothetical protein